VLANISSSNQFQNTVKLLIKYKQLELKLFATIIPILDPRYMYNMCTQHFHREKRYAGWNIYIAPQSEYLSCII